MTTHGAALTLLAALPLSQVNPRVQVEHTVTEEVTGIDIVQSQIKLAAGATLADLGLDQATIREQAHAMQVREHSLPPRKVPSLTATRCSAA